MISHYGFLSTWCIDAPIDDVWRALADSDGYPGWWKAAISVEQLEPGDRFGVGRVDRFAWRGRLPYTLHFDIRVTRVEPGLLIEGHATGELEGVGVWRLYAGRGTAVVYDWRVQTTPAWMNLIGPVARPVFVWNHDFVMNQGARGLAGALGARLIAHG
ncbi:MAG TPA: SRPBCC family protein [Solirubrobacteraceae bacterium]|jgi:hypothetical protein|nr:SRPBCC family protein [Solirubrobacteraceae bacterium]